MNHSAIRGYSMHSRQQNMTSPAFNGTSAWISGSGCRLKAFAGYIRRSGPYAVLAELSYIARWLLLWLISRFLMLVPQSEFRCEQLVIRAGNAMFRPAIPHHAYRSFSDYVAAHPADLKAYADVRSFDQWILNRSILDLGSGLGQYSVELAELGAKRVVGLEYQADKAAWAAMRSKHRNVEFVTGSAEEMPFEDGTFDTVFSHTVFEHIFDVDRALEEVRRVLKPSGIAVLSYNFFHHRGGHHLFPYVHFPWAPWLVREATLCSYWSGLLARDQQAGAMQFYEPGARIHSLSEGAEIHLNRLNFDQFEQRATRARLRIVNRLSSEQLARLVPWLVRLPRFRYFFAGTMYYALAPNGEPLPSARCAA
jgi:SAM-dependent methyltransferase